MVGIAAVLVAASVGAAAAVDAAGAGGTVGIRGAAEPLTIQAASLTQDGQDLLWQVDLAQTFSPGALRRDHRSLCLLIERTSHGSVTAEVCLAGPRRGEHTPQLLYSPVTPSGPGPGVAIDAAVSRASSRELTASFLPTSVALEYRPVRWQVASTVTATGCAPAVLGPGRCQTVFPATPALLSLHTPRLVGCTATGPDWVFHGPTDVREMALTFDDGPWDDPPTSQFVSLLAREHVPATFFEIGDQIATYDPHGTVEREMLADGDMIGDHTWSHPNLLGLSPAEQRSQLSMAAAAIRKATDGFEPCLFRAPYGAVDPALLKEARAMGFTTIQWNIDPRDWALPGVNAIIENVDTNAQSGGIVEEHFGGGPRFETLDALPTEIADLRHKGYQLVTLTQMLGYNLVYR